MIEPAAVRDRIEPAIRDVSARKAHDRGRANFFYRSKSIWTLVAAAELPRADVQIGVISNLAIAAVSNNSRHTEEVLATVLTYIESHCDGARVTDVSTELVRL